MLHTDNLSEMSDQLSNSGKENSNFLINALK